MSFYVFVLVVLAPSCHVSMQEKGKKRAKSDKCLIPGSLIGSGLGHLVEVVQAKFERVLRQAIKFGLPFYFDCWLER